MPLILDKDEDEDSFLFDNHRLHLVKINPIKSFGKENGEFIEFYYSNLNPIYHFIDSIKMTSFSKEFSKDIFLDKDFKFDDNYSFEKKLHETIKIKVSKNIAKQNFKDVKWKYRYKLYRNKFTH